MARRVYIREIYFYIVCIISIIIFIISVVYLVDSIVNYIKPTTYMTKASILPSYREQYKDLSQQEIEKLIDEEIKAQENIEKSNSLKGLIRGALLIVISIPLFASHWKLAQSMWHLNLKTDKSEVDE